MDVSVNCSHCHKSFGRDYGHYLEALKMGWRQFCSLECQRLSKEKRINTLCKNCGNKVIRQKSHVEASGNVFCSSSCSVTYSNIHRLTSRQINRVNKLKTRPYCENPNCNNQIGLESKHFCSKLCRYEYSKIKNKEFVVETIRSFEKEFHRIPMKSEMVLLYGRARQAFGTWNNAIIAAGFTPNPVRFANKFVANDGHHCDSLSEKIVDDWLFARNIPHQTKVKYPWKNGMTADFKVKDTWIELFGLTGQLSSYDRLSKIKLKKAKEANLDLISLHLSDLFPKNHLDEKLQVLQT